MSADGLRPTRLRVEDVTQFLLDCVKNTPHVDGVKPLAEVGDTKHPYGIAVRIGGAEIRWQVTGQLAPGERHGLLAADVEGEPAAWTDTGARDGGARWLADVVGRARSPKVAGIECWEDRKAARPDHVGVTVTFHNGARAFVRRLGRSTAGRSR